MPTRRTLGAALAAIALLNAAPVAAQAWPAKPIRWIVPYTPGGITDSVTRMVTQKLQESLGQSIIVDNRPGANSMLGADLVAKAPPDGYTILTVIAAYSANATLYQGRMPYDSVKDLVPVSVVALAPLILTTNTGFAPNSIKELIEHARANPGKVAFGSSGVGSAAHLTSELLKLTAGVDMLHVPYKGTAPALQGLLGGEIQVLVDVPSAMMPQARGGKVKALAMFSRARLPSAAEVPTMAESGGPALESATWVMFLAPAGTPPEIVQRLSAETAKIVSSPEIKARLEQQTIEPVGSTPAEAAKFLNEEIAKWAKVIRTADVKAD